jgi:hypothetical protein
MPAAVLGLIWLIYSATVEFRKRSSRFIPLALQGLTFCNKILCIIEIALFSAYNMPRPLWGTLLAGLFLPLLLSIGFVVAWNYMFKKDALVKEHFSIHKKVHVMSLVALFLGDYRNWKLLYTNINPAT